MQGNPERKPKHRADDDSDGFTISGPFAVRFTDDGAHGVPDCKCDPLTDGYANIDCDTHGVPVQPRQDPMGRRSRLLGEVPEG